MFAQYLIFNFMQFADVICFERTFHYFQIETLPKSSSGNRDQAHKTVIEAKLILWRENKAGSKRWTAGWEADNLLQDLFEGILLNCDRELRDILAEEISKPIKVFNQFPQFHKIRNSAVFRTQWNNEKNARGTMQASNWDKFNCEKWAQSFSR